MREGAKPNLGSQFLFLYLSSAMRLQYVPCDRFRDNANDIYVASKRSLPRIVKGRSLHLRVPDLEQREGFKMNEINEYTFLLNLLF